MDIKSLRYFTTIYELRNMSKAARKHFVSQPLLSKLLSELEKTVGKILFDRTSSEMTPTRYADELFVYAKPLLHDFDAIPLLFVNENKKEQISLQIDSDIPYAFQQDFFKKASEILPHVQWNVQTNDALLRITSLENKDSQSEYVEMWSEELVLCVPKTHDLSNRIRIGVEQLHRQPFLYCSNHIVHQQLKQRAELLGVKWNTVFNGTSFNDLLAPLVARMGITILPKYIVAGWSGFTIVRFNQTLPSRSLGIIYSKEVLKNNSVQRLIHGLLRKDL